MSRCVWRGRNAVTLLFLFPESASAALYPGRERRKRKEEERVADLAGETIVSLRGRSGGGELSRSSAPGLRERVSVDVRRVMSETMPLVVVVAGADPLSTYLKP